MKSPMLPSDHQAAVRRALVLGRSGDPAALPDLIAMLRTPSNDVQRLAVSAIGKLAEFGADAAATTADAIEHADDDESAGVAHRCQRCATPVSAAEHGRSQQAFQRVDCDRCFDEVFLERRNFETRVEINKTIEARDGTIVQSNGERLIAEWLTAHGIAYRYDAKFRIIAEFQIRHRIDSLCSPMPGACHWRAQRVNASY